MATKCGLPYSECAGKVCPKCFPDNNKTATGTIIVPTYPVTTEEDKMGFNEYLASVRAKFTTDPEYKWRRDCPDLQEMSGGSEVVETWWGLFGTIDGEPMLAMKQCHDDGSPRTSPAWRPISMADQEWRGKLGYFTLVQHLMESREHIAHLEQTIEWDEPAYTPVEERTDV